MKMKNFKPQHFQWRVEDGVAIVSLSRPERKNPITFESYAELRDTFRKLVDADDIKAVVFASNQGNFCSGGDVHDIIGPLLTRDMKGLLAFTRMTGDLVKAMRACPQPVIAGVDGVCVGAGAMIALASDLAAWYARREDRVSVHARRTRRLRHGRLRAAAARHRAGPRRGTAVHRTHHDGGGRRTLGLLSIGWSPPKSLKPTRSRSPENSREGPTFAHMMTKTMLNQEWSMSVEQAIEAEAQAQAICMQTRDFKRAYDAFVAKELPRFAGD